MHEKTTNNSKKSEANLTLRDLRLIDLIQALFKDIADPANGVNHFSFELMVDFAPQTVYQHIDNVCLRIEMIIPHMLHDHRFRNNVPCIAHQVLEERKLPRLQFDRMICPFYLPAEQIKA